LRLRLLRKNERCLARPEQLQFFPDFELLLGGIVAQFLDSLMPVIVLSLQRRILFFHFPDLIPFAVQRRDTLRPA